MDVLASLLTFNSSEPSPDQLQLFQGGSLSVAGLAQTSSNCLKVDPFPSLRVTASIFSFRWMPLLACSL